MCAFSDLPVETVSYRDDCIRGHTYERLIYEVQNRGVIHMQVLSYLILLQCYHTILWEISSRQSLVFRHLHSTDLDLLLQAPLCCVELMLNFRLASILLVPRVMEGDAP